MHFLNQSRKVHKNQTSKIKQFFADLCNMHTTTVYLITFFFINFDVKLQTPPLHDDTNQFLLTNEELSADVGDESIDTKRRESIIEW